MVSEIHRFKDLLLDWADFVFLNDFSKHLDRISNLRSVVSIFSKMCNYTSFEKVVKLKGLKPAKRKPSRIVKYLKKHRSERPKYNVQALVGGLYNITNAKTVPHPLCERSGYIPAKGFPFVSI